MPRASVRIAAMISMAVFLPTLVQTFSVPAPGLCVRASTWGVARSARLLDGICTWAMRSSSRKSSRKPGEREDHQKEPVNPRYEYVGGGFKEVEMPSKAKGANTSMYAAFDSALRASDYNMFCSPLKPVQAPTAFRSASRDVYLTESKAAELEAAMQEEDDPVEVARRTAAEYAEFSRLVSGSAVEKDGLKVMQKKQKVAWKKKRSGRAERSQPGLASAENSQVFAESDTVGGVQKGDSSLRAGGRGREVQGGLTGLAELADALESEGDREEGDLFSAQSSSSKEKLSRDLEEGYDELQKLLGVQPRPGARTMLNNPVLKGNMTAHRENGMMKKVSINDPLRRVYAQRLKDLPADVGSPEAVARPTRPESAREEGEEEEASSFVADTLNTLRSQPVAPASNPKARRPRETTGSVAGGGMGGNNGQGRKRPSEPKMGETGRVVLNHSTHVEGLIPVLRKLVDVQGISTVVPGRLFKASGRQHKLTLRVTVPTDDGFKIVARLGQQTQEVFVVCDLDQKTLEAALAWSL